jgi:hypothetical protein
MARRCLSASQDRKLASVKQKDARRGVASGGAWLRPAVSDCVRRLHCLCVGNPWFIWEVHATAANWLASRCTRVGRSAMSKAWILKINVDLGKVKQFTAGSIIGGVLTAVLIEGATTITHLAIGHGWKSAFDASGDNRPAAPPPVRPEQAGCLTAPSFNDRRQALAPAPAGPWWYPSDGYNPNTRYALLRGSQSHDRQAPVVPPANR